DGRPPASPPHAAQYRGGAGVQLDDPGADHRRHPAGAAAGAAAGDPGRIAAELPRLVRADRAAMDRAAHWPADPVVAGPRTPVPADPGTLAERRRDGRDGAGLCLALRLRADGLAGEYRAAAGTHLLLPARLGPA